VGFPETAPLVATLLAGGQAANQVSSICSHFQIQQLPSGLWRVLTPGGLMPAATSTYGSNWQLWICLWEQQMGGPMANRSSALHRSPSSLSGAQQQQQLLLLRHP
jgi:hypothetical protein